MSTQSVANTSSNGWVVQKFGGTSVGKFPEKIATDIVRLLGVYNKLKGIAAATSAENVQNDLMNQAKGLISDICNDHVSAVKTFLSQPELQASLEQEIRDECQELVEYIVAARRFNLEVNSRSKDRCISFGEKLSCRFMAALLKDLVCIASPAARHKWTLTDSQGVAAEYVDLSDAFHYDATARLDHSFYQEAAAVLRKKITACEDRVPVVTGFFGNVPGSLIDGDIGRGYTDLCAALCAVGLKADELQVWKEVDGIFTADPTKVPTARLLHSITPSEAAELTFYGSEVIHHLTMDQVIHASPPIPIRIKNVKNPRGVGTIVIPDPVLTAGHQIQRSKPVDPSLRQKPKRPTAVTIKDKISVINVHSNKRSISHGFFAKVFSILDSNQISVDLISTSEVHVSMAIHAGNSEGSSFDKARKELEECGDVSVLHDMAILSLVGAEMKNMIGIAGRMFSTLGEHNVNLEMISQGASEINISCVIEARDATRAMNILHTNLFTFLD
ncbi:Aspartate kinase FUB3 [Colletotrichum sidae]|uniref:Aspartokinase n=1 Tax=Colletotrichum sidae TaxID=1347389 RepID=A0A4R8TLB5_9PEZI|nr:Aspartate kinase FUB3 [Colletotrichum sidae]